MKKNEERNERRQILLEAEAKEEAFRQQSQVQRDKIRQEKAAAEANEELEMEFDEPDPIVKEQPAKLTTENLRAQSAS